MIFWDIKSNNGVNIYYSTMFMDGFRKIQYILQMRDKVVCPSFIFYRGDLYTDRLAISRRCLGHKRIITWIHITLVAYVHSCNTNIMCITLVSM